MHVECSSMVHVYRISIVKEYFITCRSKKRREFFVSAIFRWFEFWTHLKQRRRALLLLGCMYYCACCLICSHWGNWQIDFAELLSQRWTALGWIEFMTALGMIKELRSPVQTFSNQILVLILSSLGLTMSRQSQYFDSGIMDHCHITKRVLFCIWSQVLTTNMSGVSENLFQDKLTWSLW